MKRIIAILFLLSSFVFSRGELSGIVKNDKGVRLFSGVVIMLQNTETSKVYNASPLKDGSFLIKKIKNGRYKLSIRLDGYSTFSRTLVFDGGRLFNIDKKNIQVKLSPKVVSKPGFNRSASEEILTGIGYLLLITIIPILIFVAFKIIYSKIFNLMASKSLTSKLQKLRSKFFGSVIKLKTSFNSSKDHYKKIIEEKKIESKKAKKQKQIDDYELFGRDDIIARGEANKQRVLEKELFPERAISEKLSEENQNERLGWIYRLIFANVWIFLYMQGGYLDLFNPSRLTEDLIMYSPYIINGEVWRLITPAFIHGDIIHLICNMWILYLLSEICSILYPKKVFLASYIFFGFWGCFGSFIWNLSTGVPSLGASGAIFGIIGMLLGHYHNAAKESPIFSLLNIKFLWTYAAYTIFSGFSSPGIDNAAHIIGFVSGYASGAFYHALIEIPGKFTLTKFE